MPEPVIFNPFAPGFVEDPYAHYAELRETDPVHARPLGVWFLGAALARLEGRIYFAAPPSRFTEVALDGEPKRNGLFNLRGLAALPIAVRPA